MFKVKLGPIIIGITAALSANAGQIQIGGANGLTSAYITNPTAANGCQGTCTAGSLGGWNERSYMTALFENVSISNATSNGSTSVPTSTSATASNSTITDNNNGGVTFNLVADGVGTSTNGNNGAANNIWASINQSNTITIPVGLAGIDKAWLMLNDFWGSSSSIPTISFNFSTRSATDASPDLIDILTPPVGSLGPIRSVFDCDPAKVTGTGVSCPSQIVNGPAITTAPAGVDVGDATVYTSTIWSANYQTTSGTTNGLYKSATGGTGGTLTLDDLMFDFHGLYNSAYLVSISLTSANPCPALSGCASTNNVSRLALSGITVDQTPEPGTLALFGTGFGLIAFLRRRK